MYALPVLPPVTEAIEQRVSYLVDDYATYAKRTQERTWLIFLIQTNLFNELAASNEWTKWGDNYAVQAWRNYEAYLKYLTY